MTVTAGDPERVRVLVVTDYDVGFALMARPPLPEVAPGESYVTEFAPQRAISFDEVVVEGFDLVQMSINDAPIAARIVDHGARRLYRLEAPQILAAAQSVRLHLCNTSHAPRKQKGVSLLALKGDAR